MTKDDEGKRMRNTLEQAARILIQEKNRHDFGLGEAGDKFQVSPQRSPAGQFYLDCRKCRRTIFEDGSGTAGLGVCI